jgi:branched-chain amino acid transport system ATP-binding protein
MLAIGRALMAKPLLMLDEPSLGLAPRVIGEIFRIFETLRRAACRSCWSSRTPAPRCRWPTTATCSKSAKSCEGSAQALANDPQVAEIYLGRSPAQTTTEVPRATGT